MSNTWISKPAVLWVLYEAEDVPARLLSTLLVVAVYTDSSGKGAYVSASTVAQLTRKTERQAKRDLHELEELKLIRRGNQKLVAHIRPDRRPVVYNLPMAKRGDTHDTPSRDDTHDTPQPNGVTHRAERGDIQSQNGVSPMSPKEVQKTSGVGERAAVEASAPLAAGHTCACSWPLGYVDDEDGKGPEIACTGCWDVPEDCAAGKTDCQPLQAPRIADPDRLAALLEKTRAELEAKRGTVRGPILNSLWHQRRALMLGDGIGLVVGTAADMRTMATLLDLDAELEKTHQDGGETTISNEDELRIVVRRMLDEELPQWRDDVT